MTLPKQHATINGVEVIVDLIGLRRQPVAAQRDAQDQGTEAGEQTLMPTAQWKRSGTDWVQGAGQRYFDDPLESDRRRFRKSSGIDPWTRRQVTVLGSLIEREPTSPPSTSYPGPVIATNDDYIYQAVGSDLSFTNDTGTGFTFTTVTGGWEPIAPILDFCTDGNRVFAIDGTYIVQHTVGDTDYLALPLDTQDADSISYASGRLLVGDGPALYEVIGGAGSTLVWTHPNPDWHWTKCIGAPNAIYAFGDAGGLESAIYSINVDETDGSLTTPTLAAPMPVGELVTALTFYIGYAVIGTSLGIRVGAVGGEDEINYGPRIDMPHAVEHFAARAEFVWFPWCDDTEGLSGLGRLNLARFTNDLVPAYASDMQNRASHGSASVETTGLPVQSVTLRSSGLLVTSLAAGSGGFTGGIYEEDSSRFARQVADIYSGRITYGIPEQKRCESLEIKIDPLEAAAGASQPEVRAFIVEEDGTETEVLSIGTPGQSLARGAITGVTGEWVEVKIEIETFDDEPVPVLQRWTLWATPIVFRVEELLLPVLMSSKVKDPDGRLSSQDPLGLQQMILDLMQARTTIPVVLNGETLSCYVDGLVLQGNDQAAQLYKWDDRGSGIEGYMLVKLVTVEPST